MLENTCCFFGHRTINETEELILRLTMIIEKLITENAVDTFLFGSKSQFNSLCYKTVTTLKEKYPHINRVYVRAEYPQIDNDYKKYLLEKYEDTYYPQNILKSGRGVYIKRNYEMIEKSHFCVIYNDLNNPTSGKSGTKIAYEYAIKHRKNIINLAERNF